MAKPKTTKPAPFEPVQWHDVENNSKPVSGLGKFKVVHAVLGYKVGDEFESSHHSVRFQLKHKSIIEI